MTETRSVRAQFDKANPSMIAGYAIRFNEPTEITDYINGRLKTFTEVVRSGSVQPTADMKLLWSHDDANVLGSLSSGTAKIRTDDIGVFVEATLPESAAREREAIGRGDVDGFSFRFSVQEDKWEGNQRELLSITVPEISVVAFPAYPTAKIQAMRSSNLLRLQLAEKEIV